MSFFNFKNKQIYYNIIGEGAPLFLLHGNTASSQMFNEVLDLYTERFKVIVIDFLGHGQSNRLDEFPIDLWFEQSEQVIALIEQLQLKDVKLIGTSGGALVALNVALERQDLISAVIADSFEGEIALPFISESLMIDRAQSKTKPKEVAFWESCHGNDWEEVVDNDTRATVHHSKKVSHFFHRNLSHLTVSTLLTASKKDEFAIFVNFEKVYDDMIIQMRRGERYLFSEGGHPAMLSNPAEFADRAMDFFGQQR